MPPKTHDNVKALCFRLPPDLRAAVDNLAEQNNMTLSELVRDVLFRTVYGVPFGVEEGYLIGRQMGLTTVMSMFRDIAVNAPRTYEEAVRVMHENNPSVILGRQTGAIGPEE